MLFIQKRFCLLAGMFILAILFSILALNYHDPLWLCIDKMIQSHLYNSLGNVGKVITILITYIGSGYVSPPLTAILFIYLLFRKNYWTAIFLAVNLIGISQLNELLKSVFKRSRPDLEHLVSVSNYSFPSGHAMSSIAFFSFLAYLLNRKIKGNGKSTGIIWVVTALLILAIGLSRIYLGVHYPTDVLGGFLAGGSWLCFILFIHTFVEQSNPVDQRKKQAESR